MRCRRRSTPTRRRVPPRAGYDWDEELVRRAAPLVQEKIERLDQFPEFARFFFERRSAGPALLDGGGAGARAARDASPSVEPFDGRADRAGAAGLAERLEL